MHPVWGVALAFVLLAGVAAIRRSRAQQLVRIREGWGRQIERARRMEAMAASHAARVGDSSGSQSLDQRTWHDLNLDDVFARIDRTQSTLGQHALYHRLRTTPVGAHLEAFEALVSRMGRDKVGRERAQVALSRLQDPQGYDVSWLARPDALDRRRLDWAFPVLSASAIALFALAIVWSAAVIPLVCVLAINVTIRYSTDSRIGAIAESLSQCAPLIATADALEFLEGDDIDPIVRPLRADVTRLGRLKLISRWVNGNPFMLSPGTHPLTALSADLVAVGYEYLNLAFLLDATGVHLAAADLVRHGGALVRASAAAGDVDAAISVASYRAERDDWTRPVLRAAGADIELVDLRHPLVAEAVPNSISLHPGRGALITGSNMSGKSTFLRTVGVNVILAQTINTCLAGHYSAPILNVRSCIGRSDDLVAGKSYYVAEVEALLGLVRLSEEAPAHLFLLDELFRGTNVVERIAAGHAVLEALLGRNGQAGIHVVLAATHDTELVALVTERYAPHHFGEAVGGDGLSFDHRLRPGPARTRNAIALLRLYGAPESLVSQALATADLLDHH